VTLNGVENCTLEHRGIPGDSWWIVETPMGFRAFFSEEYTYHVQNEHNGEFVAEEARIPDRMVPNPPEVRRPCYDTCF
jgi:hypothetical protein